MQGETYMYCTRAHCTSYMYVHQKFKRILSYWHLAHLKYLMNLHGHHVHLRVCKPRYSQITFRTSSWSKVKCNMNSLGITKHIQYKEVNKRYGDIDHQCTPIKDKMCLECQSHSKNISGPLTWPVP